MSALSLEVVGIILAGLALLSILKILFDFAAKRLPPETARYFHFPSPLSLVVAGLLFIVLLVSVMSIPVYFSHLFPGCRFLRTLQRESLAELALYVSSALTAAWLIARFQKDMWLFNGFGTKIYTSDSVPTLPSVGTKWLVALFIPIAPIRSYEVRAVQEVSWDQKAYDMSPLDSIQWDQVKLTVRKNLWIYALLVVSLVGVAILTGSPCL